MSIDLSNGLTFWEFVAIMGVIGGVFFAFRLIRRAVHMLDDYAKLYAAIHHEFAPNGGRIVSAVDAEATTKDIMLDIRDSLLEISNSMKANANSAARRDREHENNAEQRTGRIIDAVIRGR